MSDFDCFPLSKAFCPLRRLHFRLRKVRFPLRKAHFNLRELHFLLRRWHFPLSRHLFPLRNPHFPLSKAPNPFAQGLFPFEQAAFQFEQATFPKLFTFQELCLRRGWVARTGFQPQIRQDACPTAISASIAGTESLRAKTVVAAWIIGPLRVAEIGRAGRERVRLHRLPIWIG